LLRKDLTEKISTKQFSEILMTYTAWPWFFTLLEMLVHWKVIS
jgi:hypothetical protein